jgi:hypothetical protein
VTLDGMARSPRKKLLKKGATSASKPASYDAAEAGLGASTGAPLLGGLATTVPIHHGEPAYPEGDSVAEQEAMDKILARRSSDMLPSVKGEVNLFDRSHFGLLVNYAVIGFLNGLLPAMVYPLFKLYLNMESYQMNAAGSIIQLPWSYKTFFGILTDHYPILGFRRKSYILLGWLLCFAALMVLAYSPTVRPYYAPGEIQRTKSLSLRVIENPEAPTAGARFLIEMLLVCLGYVIVDVACDGIMVELAQHEHIDMRGNAQTTTYIVRFTGNLFGVLAAALGLNGSAYGGSFDWSLSYETVFFCCGLVTTVGTVCAVFYLVEEPYLAHLDQHPFREMWRIVQQRAMWQLMAFHFLNTFFNKFGFSGYSAMKENWVGVEPLASSLSTCFSTLLFIVASVLMKLFLLNASWRWLMFTCSILTIATNLAVCLITTFDVVRNQWFFLGGPQLAVIPDGMRHVIAGFVTVEIAEHGFEGATYSLLTTVHNLASPFASVIYNVVDGHFAVSDSDIASDSNFVRWQVATCLLIAAGMQVAGLATLPLLPDQKQHAQELKFHGSSSRIAGAMALIVACLALAWATTVNLLAINSSTACLRIAGGRGC